MGVQLLLKRANKLFLKDEILIAFEKEIQKNRQGKKLYLLSGKLWRSWCTVLFKPHRMLLKHQQLLHCIAMKH